MYYFICSSVFLVLFFFLIIKLSKWSLKISPKEVIKEEKRKVHSNYVKAWTWFFDEQYFSNDLRKEVLDRVSRTDSHLIAFELPCYSIKSMLISNLHEEVCSKALLVCQDSREFFNTIRELHWMSLNIWCLSDFNMLEDAAIRHMKLFIDFQASFKNGMGEFDKINNILHRGLTK